MNKRGLSDLWRFNLSENEKRLNRNVLDEKTFAELLRCERERAERYGVHLSLISIKLSSGKEKIDKKTLQKVQNNIESSVRLNDRIGFIDPNVIIILLPATQRAGAFKVTQKLKNILNTHLYNYISSYNITMCCYPDDQGCGILSCAASSNRSESAFNPTIIKMDYSLKQEQSEAVAFDPALMFSVEEIMFKLCWKRFFKRVIDIIGALCGIIMFSPLFILIAIIIKITTKGPVFFRQTRLGYHGVPFTFLKFRSMYCGCSDEAHRQYIYKLINGEHERINMGTTNEPYYKMNSDARITPFGKFLRKTSLDELPQFLNVMLGQMSLVGPRPPIPYEVERYENWHKKRVFDVKPGITGMWQTSGRSTTTFDEMVRLDLQYARNWNLWLDVKIIFKTFKSVVIGIGAD
jgi:lipopolysaccharide/colanic/teichoic acid biosynthesis glycosyltransferase